MNNMPLVSIVVFSYRNLDLITDALDSILDQDYENLELIISDDCSGDFDRRKIVDYVHSKNRGNIKKLLVNENPENIGIVKHVNKTIGMSTGRFFKLVAADDALYDREVIGDFVDFFQETGALMVASQCLYYDATMTRVLGQAYYEEQKQQFRSLSPREMFIALINNLNIIAVGLCFDRVFFEKYGLHDESFRMNEDRPMWLKISRLGCPIHYMDRITAKYRLGGVSTDQLRSNERGLIWYAEDLIKVWDSEILPYKDIIGDDLWRKLISDYLRQYEWPLSFNEPIPIRFF